MPIRRRTNGFIEGWPLFSLIVAPCLVFGVATSILLPGLDGIRLVVSTTARLSAIVFCFAFAASSLHRLAPSRGSRWLLRNRRHLGLSFAALQTFHAVALVVFASMSPSQFATAVGGLVIGIFGAAGYLTTLALAITSFRPTAAALGAARWRALHRFGSYFIWFILAVAFLLHLMHDRTLLYANVELLALVMTLIVRIVAGLAMHGHGRARPLMD